MVTAPAGIAANMALAKQDFTMSVLKQNAQAQQAVANMILETVQSGSRGTNVNIGA